jgi:hypothetical protein
VSVCVCVWVGDVAEADGCTGDADARFPAAVDLLPQVSVSPDSDAIHARDRRRASAPDGGTTPAADGGLQGTSGGDSALAHHNSVPADEELWAHCVADCARSAAMSGAVCLVLYSSTPSGFGCESPEIHPEFADSPNGGHRLVGCLIDWGVV